MDKFEKLELSTETIRELSAEEMGQVAGGAAQAQSILPSCQCSQSRIGHSPSTSIRRKRSA